MKTWQALLLGVLIGLLAGGILFLVSRSPNGQPIELRPMPTPADLVIQVGGAVHQPGLYHLPPNSRIADAVQAAGGFSSEAEAASINLAAKLADGQQVWVPDQNPAHDPSGQIVPAAVTGELININTADQALLETLPGIGSGKAAEIITYRQEHGPFGTIESLLDVPGIGPGLYEQIQGLVTTGGPLP